MIPSDSGNHFCWAQDGIRQAHLGARALNQLVQAELRGEIRQESAENQPLTAFSALLRPWLGLLLLWLPLLLLASALPSAEFFSLHCLSASLCPFSISPPLSLRLDVGSLRPQHHREPVRLPFRLLARFCASLWRCACSIRGLSASTRLLSSTSYVCSTHRCPNTFFLSSSSPRFSPRSPCVILVSSSSGSSCASTFRGLSYASCALLPSSRSSLCLLSSLSSRSLLSSSSFSSRASCFLSICFPHLSRAPSSSPLPSACHCFAASPPCWHSSQPSTSRPFFLFWLLLDTICPFHGVVGSASFSCFSSSSSSSAPFIIVFCSAPCARLLPNPPLLPCSSLPPFPFPFPFPLVSFVRLLSSLPRTRHAVLLPFLTSPSPLFNSVRRCSALAFSLAVPPLRTALSCLAPFLYLFVFSSLQLPT